MRNQVTALPPGAAAAAATHGLYTAWRSPGCSTPESVVTHAELLRLDERAARPLRRHLHLQTCSH